MSASNDNEELTTLRYFMQCYWHQSADLVDGDLGASTTVFAAQEERAMLRGLLADLAKVRARGFFSARWPKKGPIHNFWAGMGDRIISDEEAELIAGVVERHLA